MIEWKTPELSDKAKISEIVRSQHSISSDTSFGNILLLSDKYNTEIAIYKGFVLRYYHGKNTRCGYTFPIGSGKLKGVLAALEADATEKNRAFDFIMLTEEQKELINKEFPDRFDFIENEGDFDYIYSTKSLSSLSGKKYQKKRNRFMKFIKQYPNSFCCPINNGNKDDALEVAEKWMNDNSDKNANDLKLEFESIKYALDNFEALELFGVILYVDNMPIAISIGSVILDNTVDVHFEKATGEPVGRGAYTTINKYFCESIQGFEWVNREEDMNIPGLRKSKRSYNPDILLKKYFAKEKRKQ